MAKYIEDGTYEALGAAASVYRKSNGNVILQTEWFLPSVGKSIRNWDCLIIGNTGEIRQKTLDGVKKWAIGWDGTTFAWFPANIGAIKAELVVENQPNNPPEYDESGNVKTYARVKWINPVGGGQVMAEDESADLDRLFGAKLRANAGARPVAGTAAVAKPATPKPAAPRPAQPAAQPQKAPQNATARPQSAGSAQRGNNTPLTKDGVWTRFCGVMDQWDVKDTDERNSRFLGLVADCGFQTDYDNWTSEKWAALLERVEAYSDVPF